MHFTDIDYNLYSGGLNDEPFNGINMNGTIRRKLYLSGEGKAFVSCPELSYAVLSAQYLIERIFGAPLLYYTTEVRKGVRLQGFKDFDNELTRRFICVI